MSRFTSECVFCVAGVLLLMSSETTEDFALRLIAYIAASIVWVITRDNTPAASRAADQGDSSGGE